MYLLIKGPIFLEFLNFFFGNFKAFGYTVRRFFFHFFFGEKGKMAARFSDPGSHFLITSSWVVAHGIFLGCGHVAPV